jgi:hypothetical protein
MKKKINYLVLMLCLCQTIFSQLASPNQMNLYLRNYYKNLVLTGCKLGLCKGGGSYLFERAVRITPESFFSGNNPDTLDADTWFQIYDEMRNMHIDTTLLPNLGTAKAKGFSYFPDTVPFAVRSHYYGKLVDAALEMTFPNSYFNIDTVDNSLIPIPGGLNYNDPCNYIFAGSPTLKIVNSTDVIFKIDSALFFTDGMAFCQSGFGGSPFYKYRVNFGDGLGFRNINNSLKLNEFFNVSYPSNGTKTITFQYGTYANTNGTGSFTVIYQSKSRLTVSTAVIGGLTVNLQAYHEQTPGLVVGWAPGCLNSEYPMQRKAVICIEGFDPMEHVPALSNDNKAIYKQMLQIPQISELSNFGYDFYVINWKKSGIDMRFNALYLVNFIELLKKNPRYAAAPDQEEQAFVIIGQSMGGVVARYALTYMETNLYQNDDYSPFFQEANTDIGNILYLAQNPILHSLGLLNKNNVEKMHRTRLLITNDSPHQGANIPLGIQIAYKKLTSFAIPSVSQFLLQGYNLFLDSKAARQLLIYHVNGKVTPSSNTSQYTSDFSRPLFMNQLSSLGNYPQYCKLVALSDGSHNGTGQSRDLGVSVIRPFNDLLLNLNATIYVNFLGSVVKLNQSTLELRNNPNNTTGLVYQMKYDQFLPKIKWKPKLFNVASWIPEIVFVTQNVINDAEYVTNTKSYCSSAGGYVGNRLNLSKTSAISGGFPKASSPLQLFNYNFSVAPSGNCLTYSAKIINTSMFFNPLSASSSLSICSNGFTWDFIPTQSALDYSTLSGGPYNLATIPLSTKLANTPFDVIIGAESTILNPNNQPHDYVRNEVITCYYSPLPRKENFYFDCATPDRERRNLNLEIGDEELFLENINIKYPIAFEARYRIHTNRGNPYYAYVSSPLSAFALNAMYSKDKLVNIIPFPFPTPVNKIHLYYGSSANNPYVAAGHVLGTPPLNPAQYLEHPGSFRTCCLTARPAPSAQLNSDDNSSEKSMSFIRLNNETFNLFPNPANPLSKIQIESTNIKSAALVNLDGSKLAVNFEYGDDGISLLAPESKGMYLLKILTKDGRIETLKLVVSD